MRSMRQSRDRSDGVNQCWRLLSANARGLAARGARLLRGRVCRLTAAGALIAAGSALAAAQGLNIAGGAATGANQQGAGAGSNWYRATLRLDAGEIPFFLQLPATGAAKQGAIRNGEELIPVRATQRGLSVTIDFPYYDSKIAATIDMHGLILGSWTKIAKGGEVRTIPFEASPVPAPSPRLRFPPPLAMAGKHQFRPRRLERMSFSGEWAMDFSKSGVAKGVFTQDFNGTLTGTILTPTGDYRYLAGNVHSDTMYLSTFDGAHAFLFKAKQDIHGVVTGEFHSGNHWSETFTARRAPADFKLPDPFKQTKLLAEDGGLPIAALDEPPFAGKPTLVVIFGTWCPNCNDEADALAEIYSKRHGDGLEILGLAYEHTTDAARSERLVKLFKERHNVTWDILIAGTSDKAQASSTMPALSTIKSFPTTIFLNRNHSVRAIHTGYAGPATGAAFDRQQADFDRLVREIIASK